MNSATSQTESHNDILLVRHGIPLDEALERASCILASALNITRDTMEMAGAEGNQGWGIYHLVEMGKAFIDAAIGGRQGGVA